MGEHKRPPLTNERQSQLAAQMMIFGRALLPEEIKRIQPNQPAMVTYEHAVKTIKACLDLHDKSFRPTRLADVVDVVGESMPIARPS